MTPRQAAELIGLRSVSYLVTLIHAKKIKAKRVKTTTNRHGYVYDVDRKSVLQFKKTPHTNTGARGQPRK